MMLDGIFGARALGMTRNKSELESMLTQLAPCSWRARLRANYPSVVISLSPLAHITLRWPSSHLMDSISGAELLGTTGIMCPKASLWRQQEMSSSPVDFRGPCS